MKEKILWGATGVAGGLLLRAAGEYVIFNADWPQNISEIALGSIRHPLTWALCGGLFGFIGWHKPEACSDRKPWYETLGEDPLWQKRLTRKVDS